MASEPSAGCSYHSRQLPDPVRKERPSPRRPGPESSCSRRTKGSADLTLGKAEVEVMFFCTDVQKLSTLSIYKTAQGGLGRLSGWAGLRFVLASKNLL